MIIKEKKENKDTAPLGIVIGCIFFAIILAIGGLSAVAPQKDSFKEKPVETSSFNIPVGQFFVYQVFVSGNWAGLDDGIHFIKWEITDTSGSYVRGNRYWMWPNGTLMVDYDIETDHVITKEVLDLIDQYNLYPKTTRYYIDEMKTVFHVTAPELGTPNYHYDDKATGIIMELFSVQDGGDLAATKTLAKHGQHGDDTGV